MTKLPLTAWTLCQIGARENYAVARAVARRGRLERLVTDVWAPPGSALARAHARLGERFHPEIEGPLVWAPTGRAVLREMGDRARRRRGWAQIIDRNAWFQREAIRALKALPADRPRTVFAYSYAAGDIFAYARARGWRTVLGQIDPGPVEARLVAALYEEAGDPSHEAIPAAYWDAWRRETELADRIVVNSAWSRDCLEQDGVPAGKIDILPLAYDPPPAANVASRAAVPAAFTGARPLRLLFLGQVTRRKGIDLVLEAVRRLADAPLRLDVVGPVQTDLPAWIANDPRIVFHGSVARSRVADFYARADLFLFPTRSDGFGLTQLEALGAGVPVIASTRCGAVVADGVNGRVLPSLGAGALADGLADVLAAPADLTRWQEAARVDPAFGLDALADRLAALDTRLTEAA